MDNSVGSAIEKIKLQEQGNEAKLKERREHDAALSSLQRSLRESLQHIEKLDQEHTQLERKVGCLRAEVTLARTRRDALAAQVLASTTELEELRTTSNQGIMKVWELRSSLCTAVQEVADDCDVRALLIKRIQPEIPPVAKMTNVVDQTQMLLNEARLKAALERKEKALKERDDLMAEPEIGEEFVR